MRDPGILIPSPSAQTARNAARLPAATDRSHQHPASDVQRQRQRGWSVASSHLISLAERTPRGNVRAAVAPEALTAQDVISVTSHAQRRQFHALSHPQAASAAHARQLLATGAPPFTVTPAESSVHISSPQLRMNSAPTQLFEIDFGKKTVELNPINLFTITGAVECVPFNHGSLPLKAITRTRPPEHTYACCDEGQTHQLRCSDLNDQSFGIKSVSCVHPAFYQRLKLLMNMVGDVVEHITQACRTFSASIDLRSCCRVNIVFELDDGLLYLAVLMPDKAQCKPGCAATVSVAQDADGEPPYSASPLPSGLRRDGISPPSQFKSCVLSCRRVNVDCDVSRHDTHANMHTPQATRSYRRLPRRCTTCRRTKQSAPSAESCRTSSSPSSAQRSCWRSPAASPALDNPAQASPEATAICRLSEIQARFAGSAQAVLRLNPQRVQADVTKLVLRTTLSDRLSFLAHLFVACLAGSVGVTVLVMGLTVQNLYVITQLPGVPTNVGTFGHPFAAFSGDIK